MKTSSHIERDTNRCGGKPCVAGTRVRVWDIHIWHDLGGQSPEQIAAAYPQVSVADVHAALAYYYDNVDAIQQHVKEADELVEAMKARYGPDLLDRSRGLDASDSVPSR